MDLHVLRDAFFETGERHDDLEGGARGELGLDGLVHQRVLGIGEVLVPLIARNAHRELVGIEGGSADEREDFAGVRVNGDHGAVAVAECVLRGALDIEVDGELEALARLGGLGADLADFAAMTVDNHVLGAVFAAQDGVVRGLDAGAAHDVAGFIHGVVGIVEHVFTDFSDVANEVSGEAVARIEAALLLDGFQFGQLVFVGLDELLFVGGDVLLERERLVFGRGAVALEDRVNLVGGHVETARDERQIGGDVVALFADEEAGDGGIVVDEEAAFAIEEFAARREDGNFADAVGFSEGVVVLPADHLQTPEAEDQNRQDGSDGVLNDSESDGGQLFVAVEHGRVILPSPLRANGPSFLRKG